MSDISDNDYLTEEEEEEDEEEEVPVHKKGIKPILPHSFGSTVTNQHIIGDPAENDDSDIEADEDADEDNDEDALEKSHTAKSAKGRKKRGKKAEEHDSDYDDNDQYGGDDSDSDSDSDEDANDDVEDQEYADDDDSDDEEGDGEGGDESERYMHHFDKEITKEYILETHPECVPVNMTEIRALLTVVRNKDGFIIDDFHKTVPYVTKYEKARIIGQRAMQLDSGATPYVPTEFLIDGASIAEREFEEKKIPVIIKRPLPNGAFEYWRLRDLEILY
jgi:DNA-directed RNA polymerase subunit K/omega